MISLTPLMVGCSLRGDAVELTLPSGEQWVYTGIPLLEVDQPVTIGIDGVVCTDRPGTLEVTDVRAEDPSSNFRIEDYSLRPNAAVSGGEALGTVYGDVETAQFQAGQTTVDRTCDEGDGGGGYEVAIQLTRTGPGRAYSRAFLLDWESDGAQGTLRVPYAVVLCDQTPANKCDEQKRLIDSER
ncbi:hypothetical protein ACIA03_08535 [Nocardioides sp. NPDC051685]|uniref:hypothetical protein n=1 Tax=Nocardioides sp. NPDC051685 TaxID=3364334 RepID=UPI0037B7ECF6